MKEQKASDIATGGETASAKQTTNANRVVAAVDASAKMTSATSKSTSTASASSRKLLIEGDTSNGGPKAAAALLSLGQDLTKGDTAVLASAAALVVPRAESNNNPLELVATSDIPMLPIDIGTKADRTGAIATATMNTNTINNDANKMKRKRSESKASKNDLGNPPDFLLWLSPGEKIGNWDVLCGRGGESNNYIGNKRYRKVVGEKKEEYRKINVKQRKLKTTFVREIVQNIKNCGGRFIDINSEGKYYVVTDDKARKKTSQALRETKELKWLVDTYDDDQKEDGKKKKAISNKDVLCPFCKKKGHKTRIAKACLNHHEWLDITNNASAKTAVGSTNKNSNSSSMIAV